MSSSPSSSLTAFETFLKFATPIGAIIAFLVGIYHYRDAQADEFKKEYWKKRYEVYDALNEIASSIAETDNRLVSDSLVQSYWILYRSKTVLVEDKHVYDAMRSYGASLHNLKIPDSLPILQNKSVMLANACRLSLKETWEPVPVSEIRSMNE